MTRIHEASLSIQDIHQDRLVRYAKEKNMSEGKAVLDIIIKHQTGMNVAEYMSEVLRENHDRYRQLLMQLGEHTTYIR